MEDYDYYLKYCDVNNSYGWSMSPKLPVNALNGLQIFMNLMKIPQKAMMIKVMKNFFLEIYFQYQENLYNFHNDLPFFA